MNQPVQPGSNPPSDRLTRFSDRTESYVKHRPSYPTAAIDAIFAGLAEPATLRVLDVGAGTGISSRLLADRGAQVIALEPNEAMRLAGTAEPHPCIEWIGSTGESTGLAHDSIDVVACFQAFHWLDAAKGLAEFRRVLRPDGRVAIVWNVQDKADRFTAEYQRIILKHATDPPTSPWLQGFGNLVTLLTSEWSEYRELAFPNEQSLDLAGLIGRATSASYSPNAGPGRDALQADLTELFRRFGAENRVKLRYACVVHMAAARQR